MKAFADSMVWTTFLGALLFVVIYLGRNWRSSAVARNVMVFMVVIMVVSGLAVSTIIWGREWPHRDLIRGVCWAMVAGVIWWRNVLLLHTPARRSPPSDADPPDPPLGADADRAR